MPHFTLDGAAITYREAGDGPPVILLHASSSHSGQWKPLIDALSERFRVLAPDFHGYGRSDALPDTRTPYFHRDAAIVTALMEEDGAPAHLVGHSLGGTVAARVAAGRPDGVASLTLIEPVLFNLLEERKDVRCREYLELAHAMMVLVRFGEHERAARMFHDHWSAPATLDTLDAETRDYIVRTIPRAADDWYGISALAPGALTIADLSTIRTPVLLMCAQHTPPATRGITEILRETLPHAEYREVEGAGHMAPVTHPEAVNPVIADFLDRMARPG